MNKKNFDLTRNTVLKHIFVGLQKSSSQDIEKTLCSLFEGVERYLYLRFGESIWKIPTNTLKKIGISTKEAWEIAMDNVRSETTLKSLNQTLEELSILPDEKDIWADRIFVVSNKTGVLGAAGILNAEVLEEFVDRCKTNRFIVCPFSIHEMVLLPCSEKLNVDEISNIVKEINHTILEESERLIDKVIAVTWYCE